MKTKVLVITLVLFLAVSSIASAITFKDLNNHWARATVEWATENTITEGYPDKTFKPDKTVSEAEFLAMLIRAFKPKDLTETKIKHWADGYYIFATAYNYPVEGAFSIDKRNWPISRTRVAELVSGTQGVNYSGDYAIQYLLGKGLAKGKNPNEISIESYDGEGTLTRAEAVQFIKNLKDKGIQELKVRPFLPSDPVDLPPLPKTDEQTKLENVKEVLVERLKGTDNEIWINGDAVVATGVAAIEFADPTDPEQNNLIDIFKANTENGRLVATEMINAAGVPVDSNFPSLIKQVYETRETITLVIDGVNIRIVANEFNLNAVHIYFK
ncbi:S-layer homology domain-containing protein [Microaerobacter geothermalis]|uniref:S-layer homology domain-containing protein n=1 Tax=Microaerobacter geothermalis TaxID=674972 RepID=UPI001F309EC0|nr:S-layer homology domain-containing protein [Microaerobacter geothermalis]MCF6094527.1 S-layer homology domain-containing protein [Microaerobacter geothermalis]